MEGRFSELEIALRPFRQAVATAAAGLFPHFCQGCRKEGPILCEDCRTDALARVTGIFVCPGCGETSTFGRQCGAAVCRRRSSLDAIVSMASYKYPALRTLLHAYKYEGIDEAGISFDRLFEHFLRSRRQVLEVVVQGSDILTVPAHRLRSATRGFDHCELFAGRLASVFAVPRSSRILGRRFRHKTQASISSEEARRENAAGSVIRVGDIKHRRYVIFDDVVTTGATLEECAKVLKAAGAKEVAAVTLLRG